MEIKNNNGFYSVDLKVANLRKPQNFTLYSNVKDNNVWLQSSKRFIVLNLETGEGLITTKNKNYPSSYDLYYSSLKFQADPELIKALKDHYDKNKVGTNSVVIGGVEVMVY
jgi:hypothetical protein